MHYLFRRIGFVLCSGLQSARSRLQPTAGWLEACGNINNASRVVHHIMSTSHPSSTCTRHTSSACAGTVMGLSRSAASPGIPQKIWESSSALRSLCESAETDGHDILGQRYISQAQQL
jgi:hypothetical protein